MANSADPDQLATLADGSKWAAQIAGHRLFTNEHIFEGLPSGTHWSFSSDFMWNLSAGDWKFCSDGHHTHIIYGKRLSKAQHHQNQESFEAD